jgi:tetratricopeptide (TPR) repeat protein
VKGRTLGEAFYLAMPSVGWQSIVLGDPLCAPFAPASHTAEPPQAPVDTETLMPRWFSDRRLAVLSRSGRDPKALRYLMRAEVLAVRNDTAELQKALEKATELDERLVAAHLQLAEIADRQGQYEEAIARYRRILAINPDDPLALNNLAYALAVRTGRLEEALPLAEKANTLAPNAAALLDTLGWIHLLRGKGADAIRLLEQAVSRAPNAGEIRFHLATAYAEMGRPSDARTALDAAVKADPSIASRPDVLKLRDKLKP